MSTTTYDELQGLVKRQADWLGAHDDIPEPLAPTAAEFLAGNDYVSAYWKNRGQYSDAQQFRKAYSQLALLLENLYVQVSKELVADIAGSIELRGAVAELRLLKPNDPARTMLSCMSAASWLAAARSLTAWLADFGNHRANAWLGVELH